jgi:transaldolase
MKIFIDSADLAEVKKYMDWGLCDGVTTNPTIFLKAGIRGGKEAIHLRARALAQLIHPLPLSIEVTSDDPREIFQQAKKYAGIAQNISVKVTIIDQHGNSLLPVIRQLAANGISVNVTAMTTFNQMIFAAKALHAGYQENIQTKKSGYISIFAGRISEEQGVEQAFKVVEEVRLWLDRHKMKSAEIIVGSVRSPENVEYWSRTGAHILTIPPDILAKILQSARTKETVVQFLADAKKSLSEIG